MSVYKRGDSETWWIDVVAGGRRVRRSSGTPDRKEAQRIHDEVKAALWQQKRSGHRLNEAYVLWLQESARSRQERSAIKVLREVYPDRPLAEVSGESFRQALAGKSPATFNRYLNILRACVNLAVERGLLDQAPDLKARQLPATSFRWLTREEWKKLDAELAPHLQRMARFALATGLRWANVRDLEWSHVDLVRKLVWVDAPKMKARKAHRVPLSSAALAVLAETPAEARNGAVFLCRGKRIKTQPKTGWNAAVVRAGIDQVRWHDLRHTWASWHVQAGTPLEVLRVLGGWSSMDMVMRYAHMAEDYTASFAENSAVHSAAQRKQKPKPRKAA